MYVHTQRCVPRASALNTQAHPQPPRNSQDFSTPSTTKHVSVRSRPRAVRCVAAETPAGRPLSCETRPFALSHTQRCVPRASTVNTQAHPQPPRNSQDFSTPSTTKHVSVRSRPRALCRRRDTRKMLMTRSQVKVTLRKPGN
jgi:hypothetical protein